MAYNNSGLLSMGSTYNLGQYSIRCFDTTEAGVRYVLAHISGPEGNAQTGIIIPKGTPDHWRLEANESEVTVYAQSEGQHGIINAQRVVSDILFSERTPYRDPYYRSDTILGKHNNYDCTLCTHAPSVQWMTRYNGYVYTILESGDNHFELADLRNGEWSMSGGSSARATNMFTSAVWHEYFTLLPESTIDPEGHTLDDVTSPPWERIVARFPIILKNAGGGPQGSDPSWGSDVDIWDEPGDVDYDWEPEEPTKTLYLIGKGATSGRHNDPIVDPSYSYVPKSKDTVKSEGNGGDGGNGGGDGAGASTLVTRPFGTGQADNKDITLHARRHGYGSTGGKGGKAGDGCILIYYRTGDEE